ncbi:MAG TPA: hypothetical protein VMX57_03730, partial [Planctomycetota bacterium]|nr:hypothetical protein [Planctomycetota bacterium]
MRLASVGAMIALALMLSAGVLRAAELKLTVDWPGVTLDETFPVTGGIPFARGALKSPGNVKLLSEGKAILVQAKVLAVWPDKSVKWLLLDFQAKPSQKEFTLEYGDGVRGPEVDPLMFMQQTDALVTVNTGAVSFTVRKDGGGFIDAVSFGEKKLFDSTGKRLNVFDFIHTEEPADYHPMNAIIREGFDDPSKVVVDAVTLEKPGPLHAVVRIDGRYTFQNVGSTIEGTDVKGDCPFRVRIHAFAGKSYLKVEHFFIYEGDGDHDFAKTLALKVGLPAGEGRIRVIGEDVKTLDGPLAGLYQETADAYTVWTSQGKAARVASTGRRFDGVLDVIRGDVGVAVGIKDFWKTPAKSLHADLNAGLVSINLWAPEAPPLDFRRHAREWSVGETGTPN